MTDLTVTLRLIGTGDQLSATVVKAREDISKLGVAGKQAGQQASAGMAQATAGTKEFAGSATAAGQAALRMGQNTAAGGAQAAAGLRAVSVATGNLQKQMVSLRSDVAAILSVSLGVAAIRQINNLADGYTNINSKLRNVTDSEVALIRVRERAYEIAQLTRSSFEGTVNLYTRITRATETLALSEENRLRITESINKAYIVAGATYQEATNSIIQLTQGLAAGALRGEEFNSVAEQGPIILDILGKSLGKTRGELRAMAKEGELTAEVITNAILENSEMIDAQFNNIAVTVEGASVRVTNAWQKWIGESSNVVGASSAVAAGLTALASNFDLVATAIISLIALMTTRYLSALIGAGIAAVQAGNAAAAAALETQTLAAAEVKAAQAAEIEALALLNKTRAMTAAGAATGSAVAAETAYAAAQLRSAEAVAASGAAMAVKTGLMARLGSGLLALVGGPIGAAIIGITALVAITYSWITAEEERIVLFNKEIDSMRLMSDATEDLHQAYNDFAEVPPTLAAGFTQLNDVYTVVQAKQIELAEAQERLSDATDQNDRSIARFGLETPGFKKAQDEVSLLTSEIDRLTTAQATLTNDLMLRFAPAADVMIEKLAGLRNASDLGTVFTTVGDAIGGFLTQVGAIGEADAKARNFMTELSKEATNTADALDKHGKSAAQVAQEMVNLGIEQMKAAGMSDILIAKKQAEGNAYVEAAAKLEALNKKSKSPKDDKTAEKELRALQRAIEASRQFNLETEKLASTMIGPMAEATAAYNAEFSNLEAQHNAGTISLTEFGSRMEIVSSQFKKTTASLETQADVMSQLAADTDYEQSLVRMTAKERVFAEAFKKATDEFNKNKSAVERGTTTVEEFATAAGDAAVATYQLKTEAAKIDDILQEFGTDNFRNLTDDIDLMGKALEKAIGAKQTERVKELSGALGRMRKEQIHANIGAFLDLGQAIVGVMKNSAEEGTKYYAALEVAQAALALGQGINAILTQGQGDPYSAFPRMAAMAAIVIPLAAQLGASITALGNAGFSDTSAQRQASQGTGSVLGDTEAKSESIMNSAEITANATEQLVAINRGMLNALNTLVAGLGSAANQLARGAGTADFSGQNLAVGNSTFFSNSINDPFGFFGGSSKITDEGIIIFGGALSDMLDNIAVGAYQEVQSRSWAFGSTHTNEGFSAVSDEFANQFQLVIGSIIDTVREGALALGILPADFQAALDAYAVEEIRISLKDLSAEEAQAELQAVFSQLFDGLAGSVVPFIAQFQQVGEGLGETLIRVATGVQVTQEAVRQLGLVIDETDPEKFAQISEGLIDMVGGIDALIEGMSTFVNNFAPDSYQFAVAATTLSEAFSQAGLTIPETADGMWELMQSMDATTEEGRQGIATLLRLASISAEYYDGLEEQVAILEGMGLATQGLSEFGKEILKIRSSGTAAAAAANAIAIAQGRQGASMVELARIRQWTLAQEAAAIRRLQQATMDLIAQLYGGLPGSLEAIEAEIARLEGLGGGISSGFDSAIDSSENFFASWQTGMQSLNDYMNSMLFGDLSALSAEDQLAEMWRQFNEAQQAALGGDVDALASLPQMANALLEMIREQDTSGNDYNAQFYLIRDLLAQVQNTANPYTEPTTGVGGTGGGNGISAAELQALYEARDALLLEQENAYRAELAQQLAQNLSDLAILLNVPILEMIELQGVSLEALAADLGVNLLNLTEESVLALGNMATTLGISLGALTSELGIELTDLAGGLSILTERVGIDLQNMTVQSTQSLATLAISLGADLAELSESLGLDLGSLVDAQSLLNQALAAEIQALPTDQASALAPLLDAVAMATTEADANAALEVLNNAINELAPDIRNLLAPYLEGVFPVQALSQLDYLEDLQALAQQSLSQLTAIRDNLKEQNRAGGIPSYEVGSGYIPATGMAFLHQGEAVVPAHVNSWLRQNGFPAASNDSSGMATLNAQVAELQRAVDNNTRVISGTIEKTSDKASRDNVDAIDNLPHKLASTGRSIRL
jgi:tape measure domain-containing protein